MTRRPAAVGVVALALAVGGCAAVPDPSRFADATAALQANTEEIVLPLDREYLLNDAELALVEGANYALTDSCMQRSGYRYPLGMIDWSRTDPTPDRRYGLWSPSRAAQFGYDLPPAPADDAIAEVIAASEDAQYYDMSVACLDTTEQLPLLSGELVGGDPDAERLLEVAVRGAGEARTFAEGDPLWERTIGAWRECLSDAGVGAPSEPGNWTPSFPRDDAAAQVRIAIADVQCKEQTDLVQTLANLEAQYQAAFIDVNEAALEPLATAKQETIERARAILLGATDR